MQVQYKLELPSFNATFVYSQQVGDAIWSVEFEVEVHWAIAMPPASATGGPPAHVIPVHTADSSRSTVLGADNSSRIIEIAIAQVFAGARRVYVLHV
jgi:hypothetical protein